MQLPFILMVTQNAFALSSAAASISTQNLPIAKICFLIFELRKYAAIDLKMRKVVSASAVLGYLCHPGQAQKMGYSPYFSRCFLR